MLAIFKSALMSAADTRCGRASLWLMDMGENSKDRSPADLLAVIFGFLLFGVTIYAVTPVIFVKKMIWG